MRKILDTRPVILDIQLKVNNVDTSLNVTMLMEVSDPNPVAVKISDPKFVVEIPDSETMEVPNSFQVVVEVSDPNCIVQILDPEPVVEISNHVKIVYHLPRFTP